MDLLVGAAGLPDDVGGFGSVADIVMGAVAVVSLIGAVVALRQTAKANAAADRAAKAASDANSIAIGANGLAQGANTLAGESNTLAEESNVWAREASTLAAAANSTARDANTLAAAANAVAGEANGLATEANRVALSRAVYDERRRFRNFFSTEFDKLADTFEPVAGMTFPRERSDAVSEAFVDKAREIGPGIATAAIWVAGVFADYSIEARKGDRSDDLVSALEVHNIIAGRLARWMDGDVYDHLDTTPLSVAQLWNDGLPSTTDTFI